MSGAGHDVDVVIFGGGAAGLWLLDALTQRGDRALLLETQALGHGQTIASQGIIHGGLKYTLKGLLSGSAKAIRDMPTIWRDCLAGRTQPDLSRTRVRAEHCYLWSTQSLRSRAGLVGAKRGLRVAPEAVEATERPAALATCPGAVLRVAEQVISPAGFLSDLAGRHTRRLLKVEPAAITIEQRTNGVTIRLPSLRINARHAVFCAGGGNARLRKLAGLGEDVMQRRPLHMVMLRGSPDTLPELNGHCTDGAHTRVTITSDVDARGCRVWQIGGQISEDGVAMEPIDLARHARAELAQVLPGLALQDVAWATYRVDRAEKRMAGGMRPDNVTILDDGPILTCWPTKLALVPELARRVLELIAPSPTSAWDGVPGPRPAIALPPWEATDPWFLDIDS